MNFITTLMLPKKNRADTKTVEKIFKSSRFLSSPNLSFKFILSGSSAVPQISFLAPKNISKKAVERNLLRRQGYSALEKSINRFPLGITGVFIFKKYQDDVLILENEIEDLLNKIN